MPHMIWHLTCEEAVKTGLLDENDLRSNLLSESGEESTDKRERRHTEVWRLPQNIVQRTTATMSGCETGLAVGLV